MAATPKVVTDGSSDLDEAVLNLFVNGIKAQVKVNFFAIQFVASTNTPSVLPGIDSDGEVVTGDLSWNAGTTQIDITLSGFSAAPVAIVVISDNNSTNVGDAIPRPNTSSAMSLRFIGASGGDVAVDPDGDVRVQVLLIGS